MRFAALIAAGYGLTLAIFYPGIMTYDAKFVHEDIAKGVLGDWQSPVMTVLWGVIDPIAPGAASMFLLIATSYWIGFGLLAFAVAHRSSRQAKLVMVDGNLALSRAIHRSGKKLVRIAQEGAGHFSMPANIEKRPP